VGETTRSTQADLSLVGRYPGWAIATCETFPDLFQIQWQRAQAEVPGWTRRLDRRPLRGQRSSGGRRVTRHALLLPV